MVVRLGSTHEDVDSTLDFGKKKIGYFKDLGTYIHRVLKGPFVFKGFIYPAWKEDFETGEMIPTYHKIVVPQKLENTIMDKLAFLDRQVQSSLGGKDRIVSQFAPSTLYIFAVIDRKASTEDIWVGFWEYKRSLVRDLNSLQKKLSTKDSEKLMYGPYWSYDVVIEKKYDEVMMEKTGGNLQYSTRYELDIDPETLVLSGKYPAKYLNRDYYLQHKEEVEEFDNKCYAQVFSEEELSAIQEFFEKNNPEHIISARDNQELLEELKKFPINWDAEIDGQPAFPHRDKLFKKLEEVNERLLNMINKTLPDGEYKGKRQVALVDSTEKESSKEEIPEPPKEADIKETPKPSKEAKKADIEEADVDEPTMADLDGTTFDSDSEEIIW